MWLDRRLMDSPIYFCLCVNEKQFREQLEHLEIKEELDFVCCGSDAVTYHFKKGDGKLAAIVCFKKDKSRDMAQNIALLVHEAVHIWQEVRKAIGEDFPSKEFEAYSIQSISQELISSFLKIKK